MRTFPVNVTDVDINSHKSVTNQMYLKRHWAVNAANRPLATLGPNVLCALAQRLAATVLHKSN